MKKIVLLVISLSVMGYDAMTLASPQKGEMQLDQVVAIVNDDVITQTELNRAAKSARLQNQSTNDSKKTLDQVINRKLQLQVAHQIGIRITDQELDLTIKKVAEQNNLSVDELYVQLSHEGMSREQYRKEMQEQMTLRRLQQQEVASKLTVSSQEVNHFVQSHAREAHNEAKEYRIQDILIPLSDTASADEIEVAKKQAEQLFTELNKSKQVEMVISNSQKLKRFQVNDLGWLSPGEIPTAFFDQVTSMQKQEMRGPIQTSNGFHLIRLSNLRSQKVSPNTPDLKQAEELLLEQKFSEAIESWLSRIRHQAYIKITSEA